LFKPILIAAYDKACGDVLNVQSEIRHTRKGTTEVVVSCDGQAMRAVRVIYTGVTVPKLVGFSGHGLEALAAMLGLRIHVTSRLAQPREQQGIVISQHPSAGVVVPSGTRITAICNCLLKP
jgi:hypothetical protein